MNGTLDEPKYGALRKVTARVQANDATGEDLDSDRFDEIVAFSDNFSTYSALCLIIPYFLLCTHSA